MTSAPHTHEGIHTRPDASQFSVEWFPHQRTSGDNIAGWYWYNFHFDETTDTSGSSHGPFNTSAAAFDAGLIKDC